jgi:2',3'-cyclic-nucleotide 2'-phosphodiesterase
MQNSLKFLIIGDISGNLGLAMLEAYLGKLKERYKVDGIIVNGENAGNQGKGITPKIVTFMKNLGVNVITSGNHIWAKREILPYLASNTDLLRPANFPAGCPGVGVTTFDVAGISVGVVNVQGRIFMRELLDCPFKTMDSILTYLKDKTNKIIVDIHAETTSEKIGMGLYLDGRVSAVVGTHTHVQTADERVLPKGTAFITDLGMVGALDCMIGMKKEPILGNMLTQMPHKFEVCTDAPAVLAGVVVEVDKVSGKALDIQRVRIVDEDIKPIRM